MSGISYTMPRFQAIDQNGNPMVGATLYTYQNKTTTPHPTWKDKDQTAYNTNPIVLDARGEAVIWLDPEQVYTFVLRDWFGVLVWSQDDIAGTASQIDLAAPDGASMVGFIQEGTGAVPRTMLDKAREVVSVLDYESIQEAFDSSEGREVRFPAGNYNLTAKYKYSHFGNEYIAGVRVYQNTRVVFEPGVTITADTYEGAEDFRAIFLALDSTNVEFRGPAKFLGGGISAGRPKVGIVLSGCSDSKVIGCRFENFRYHGVAAYANENNVCRDILFDEVVSDNGAASSIIAYSSFTNSGTDPNERITVRNCKGLNSSGYFGLELRGCVDSVVEGGYYEGNETGGINIEENSHRVVIENAVSRNNRQGIAISGNQLPCNDVTLRNCFVDGNSGSSVSSYAGDTLIIDKCKITNGGSVGVNILTPTTLPPTTNVLVKDTHITGHVSNGGTFRGTGVTLDNCTVTGNGFGVQVSADGFKFIGGTIQSVSYDLHSRTSVGYFASVDSNNHPSFNLVGRLNSNIDRTRLVAHSPAAQSPTGVELGSLEFVWDDSASGHVEIYGRLANARQHLASFTRNGDVALPAPGRGVICVAPDGSTWRIRVNNSGAVVTDSIT